MKAVEFPKIAATKKILSRPIRQPEHTSHCTAYELGQCFQLDNEHGLLVASLDEQGGGDLCVGNDAFIFQRLEDIQENRAIPLNGPDPAYRLKATGKEAFLAKFPATGNIVPLGAKMPNGKAHPGAGYGILISTGMTFNADRSSAGADSEVTFEIMQVRWDGKKFEVTQRTFIETLLGKQLTGLSLSHFLIEGEYLLAPLSTKEGIVVFRFEFKNGQWQAVTCGKPFITYRGATPIANLIGENEPSLQKKGKEYYVYTRGTDPVGRLYRSQDGLNYQLLTERFNNTVPQALNKGLDGSLYIATNPNMDVLRNPLVIYPLVERSFDIPNYTAEPIIIHDQDGVRHCAGDSIPFVDHAIGVNQFLEGRWRHLLWYRVCDLKERTPHAFQPELKAMLGEPKARAAFDGVYMCELMYGECRELPYSF